MGSFLNEILTFLPQLCVTRILLTGFHRISYCKGFHFLVFLKHSLQALALNGQWKAMQNQSYRTAVGIHCNKSENLNIISERNFTLRCKLDLVSNVLRVLC